jgi:hypothetical protein
VKYTVRGYKPSGATVVKMNSLREAFAFIEAFTNDALVKKVTLVRSCSPG